jgi:hypothetical protein
LDYSGSVVTGSSNRSILAGSHTEAYPSDQKISWMNTVYDSDSDNYIIQYLAPDAKSPSNGKWDGFGVVHQFFSLIALEEFV